MPYALQQVQQTSIQTGISMPKTDFNPIEIELVDVELIPYVRMSRRGAMSKQSGTKRIEFVKWSKEK